MRPLALLLLAGCLAPGAPTEPAVAALDRAACDARAAEARATCVAECSSEGAQRDRLGRCAGTADTALSIVAGDLVGSTQASRSNVVLPIDACIGAALVSSCGQDRAALATIAGRKVEADVFQGWLGSSAPPDCTLAKLMRQTECIRAEKTWIQVAATSPNPLTQQAGQALWIKLEALEWSLGSWADARLGCEAGGAECIDDCGASWGDWLSCRWQCPGARGSACVPTGKTAACGVVRYGLTWDAGFACECSADTDACRAP